MALPSEHIPSFVTGKTPEDVRKELARVQSLLFGKVAIVSIYWDSSKKQHVCWYLPPKGFSGGQF